MHACSRFHWYRSIKFNTITLIIVIVILHSVKTNNSQVDHMQKCTLLHIHTCHTTVGPQCLSCWLNYLFWYSPNSISLMNLFQANPALMVSTALGLWVDRSLKCRFIFLTLAAATASTASFQLSSLNSSWIRREHGRNKSHYHTQGSFTSVACPQKYQWSA